MGLNVERSNEICLWHQGGFHSRDDTNFWKKAVCSEGKWRKEIPGRGDSVGKCLGFERQNQVRNGEFSKSKSHWLDYDPKIQHQVCSPRSKQPIHKLINMSYLQTCSLSKCVSTDSIFPSPNISTWAQVSAVLAVEFQSWGIQRWSDPANSQ